MPLFTNESDDLSITQALDEDRRGAKLQHTLRLLQLHGDVQLPPRDQLLQIFKSADRNNDGSLSQAELYKLIKQLYKAAVARAAQNGAPSLYIARAREALETNRGKEVMAKATRELHVVLDVDKDGQVTAEEFCALLQSERSQLLSRSSHWRMAPLLDLRLSLDDFVDDYRTPKLFIAGAVAGACARTAGAPLGRIAILQQTAASGSAYSGSMIEIGTAMVKKEGLRGIFRGNFADVCRAAPQQGIAFLIYERAKTSMRQLLRPVLGKSQGADFAVNTMAGGCSGVVSVLCTYPLDLVRTRMAASAGGNQSIASEMRSIVQTSGMRGLYRGCGVACAEKFPNLAINFALYDVAKDYSRKVFPDQQHQDMKAIAHGAATTAGSSSVTGAARTKTSVNETTTTTSIGSSSILRSLCCGVFAGAVSNAATFPLDVIMKNLQLDGQGGSTKRYTGAMDCASKIMKNGGVLSLYSGLRAQLCKAVPVAATSFVAYDAMKINLGCVVHE